MPEKPEAPRPDAVGDDELEDVAGGRILAPENSNIPICGPDGRPLDFPA